MSKGRGGTSPYLNVRSRQRSTVILEASPSTEIASYDYEATLDERKFDESRVSVKEAGNNALKDEDPLKTTPTELEKGCNERTVCFLTDNQTLRKLNSVSKTTGSSSLEESIRGKCATCETIVRKFDDGSGSSDVNSTTNDSKVKELSQNPATLVSGMKKQRQISTVQREKKNHNSKRLETSSKSLAKKNVDNSCLLLDSNKSSKIPRASTVTDPVEKFQIASIPSRGNLKINFCSQAFFNTRSKSVNNSVAEPTQSLVPKTCNSLEETKKSNESITALKLKGSRASRINLLNEQLTSLKTDEKLCDELTLTRVSNSGDHSSPSSKMSLPKNLRLNNNCRSCNDQRETVNLQLSIREVRDPWSDSKSSPEIRHPNGWSKSLKMSPYVDSTSEDVDLSSDYSTDSMRPRKKKCLEEKTRQKNPISKSGYTKNSPQPRPRHEARFSFFNTLFDIVFWPFIFLRTNR